MRCYSFESVRMGHGKVYDAGDLRMPLCVRNRFCSMRYLGNEAYWFVSQAWCSALRSPYSLMFNKLSLRLFMPEARLARTNCLSRRVKTIRVGRISHCKVASKQLTCGVIEFCANCLALVSMKVKMGMSLCLCLSVVLALCLCVCVAAWLVASCLHGAYLFADAFALDSNVFVVVFTLMYQQLQRTMVPLQRLRSSMRRLVPRKVKFKIMKEEVSTLQREIEELADTLADMYTIRAGEKSTCKK